LADVGSGIEGMRHQSAFASYVAERLGSAQFMLVDIGCAGGVAPGWRAFGAKLSAWGFDATAEEIERLKAAEANPEVRYAAGFIGLPDGHPLKARIAGKAYWHQWPSGRLSYERTQDIRRARAEGRKPRSIEDYYRDRVLAEDWGTLPHGGFDLDYAAAGARHPEAEGLEGQPPVIHLPQFLESHGFSDVDFVKLDIDGPEFEVLRSLNGLLDDPGLLGVSLEVCYFGSHDANDNSFHNMDRLMRENGFDLFGLSVRGYSGAALPWPYLDAHPSMTTGGRPVQGDALYIRDLASRVRRAEAAALSAEKLAKTAALLALFTLPDQAAELLIVHRERLQTLLDVDRGLDLLAREMPELYGTEQLSYRDYVSLFEADDPRFFDVYTARNTWMARLVETAREAPAVEARLEVLTRELEQARYVAEAAQAEADSARRDQEAVGQQALALAARLHAVEQSTLWRLTGPLRRLGTALKGSR
jgi:hypothetical protein